MLAGAQAKGLEQVAFAGACLTGDDDVIVATDKVEATEFDEEGLVEGGLKSQSKASKVFRSGKPLLMKR